MEAFDANEGCMVLSDTSGQLMMYSDGQQVWNKNHQVMPGGEDLGGHYSATQSGIILKKPGAENLYYIFSGKKKEEEVMNMQQLI